MRNQSLIFIRGKAPTKRPDVGTVALYFDARIGAFRYVDAAGTAHDFGGGTGVEEAPVDGTPYVRQDAGWVSAASGSGLTQAQILTRHTFGGF